MKKNGFALLCLAACSGGTPPAQAPSPAPSTPRPATPPPSYEVHEWGLLRGSMSDAIVLGGPRAPLTFALAKPVLYFHRDGEGPLSITTRVELVSGRMVEHWPLVAGSAGASLTWDNVVVAEGNCTASNYPALDEPPCVSLGREDGCEAAQLREVETADGDCLSYQGKAYDHLFYRGELAQLPNLPVNITGRNGQRTITVQRAVQGSLIRVQSNRAAIAPAQVGANIELLPTRPMSEAAAAFAQNLAAAGLTAEEVNAFRRAWETTLFPGADRPATVTTIPPTSVSPQTVAHQTDWLLYVLSAADAESLATLHFTPEPRRTARVMVVWFDLNSASPASPDRFFHGEGGFAE